MNICVNREANIFVRKYFKVIWFPFSVAGKYLYRISFPNKLRKVELKVSIKQCFQAKYFRNNFDSWMIRWNKTIVIVLKCRYGTFIMSTAASHVTHKAWIYTKNCSHLYKMHSCNNCVIGLAYAFLYLILSAY